MPAVRAHVLISGEFEPRLYAEQARDRAESLGVAGWIRLRSDGGLETTVEAEPEELQQMLAWCRWGPPSSRVDVVEITFLDPEGESAGFRIAEGASAGEDPQRADSRP